MRRSHLTPSLHLAAGLLTACGAVLFTLSASAEGLIFNAGGTKALGRGGAVSARPDDPIVLHFNPAGLAMLQHRQLLLNADVGLYDACVEPVGYYGWGVYAPGISEFGDSGQIVADANGNPAPGQYATEPLDEVCASGQPGLIPQLAFAWRLTDRIGVGFGFVGPATLGNQQWGGDDATIERRGVARPTPTRYQTVSQQVPFGLNPTAGVGVAILDELRVGAAFQWLMLSVESAQVQAQEAGTSPHSDMLVTASATDLFIPGITVSAHATPLDELDLVLAFQWRDRFDAEGEAVFETNTYHVGDAPPGVPYENDPVHLSSVSTGFPWNLTAGARWAERRRPRVYSAQAKGAPLDDPLSSEAWDVEFDVTYAFTSRLSRVRVEIENRCELDSSGNRILVDPERNLHQGCEHIEFRSIDSNGNLVTDFVELPPENLSSVTVDKKLRDQVILRLGGSYNVFPDELALNAGVYYETRGLDPAYITVDNMPAARFGMGFGAIYRIGALDVMASYGHVFQETLAVGAPPHQDRDLADTSDPRSGFDKRVGQPCALGDPGCVDPQPLPEQNAPLDPDATAAYQQSSFTTAPSAQRRVVNAGIYKASFDVISVGAVYRF